MTGLDNPATGTPPRRAELEPDLVAAGSDVRCEAALDRELVHPGVVVAAVEAQTLRPLATRLWLLNRDRGEGRL